MFKKRDISICYISGVYIYRDIIYHQGSICRPICCCSPSASFRVSLTKPISDDRQKFVLFSWMIMRLRKEYFDRGGRTQGKKRALKESQRREQHNTRVQARSESLTECARNIFRRFYYFFVFHSLAPLRARQKFRFRWAGQIISMNLCVESSSAEVSFYYHALRAPAIRWVCCSRVEARECEACLKLFEYLRHMDLEDWVTFVIRREIRMVWRLGWGMWEAIWNVQTLKVAHIMWVLWVFKN